MLRLEVDAKAVKAFGFRVWDVGATPTNEWRWIAVIHFSESITVHKERSIGT